MANKVFNVQNGSHGEKKHQILLLKSTAGDLFYPTVPTYYTRQENSNEEKDKKKDARNE